MNPITTGAGIGLILALSGLIFGVSGFLFTAFMMAGGAVIGWLCTRLDIRSIWKSLIDKTDTRSD